jgi:hypothetical protein
MKEFIIWGKPHGGRKEQILQTEYDGKKITDKILAENLKKHLYRHRGCTELRVQVLEFQEAQTENKTFQDIFTNTINFAKRK